MPHKIMLATLKIFSGLVFLGLVVGATMLLATTQGQTFRDRLTGDYEAGVLTQTVTLGVIRFTRPIRLRIADALGLRQTVKEVEDSGLRARLPTYRTLLAARFDELTVVESLPAASDRWSDSFANPRSTKYIDIRQVNRSNVNDLTPAWTFLGADEPKNVQTTPIFTGRFVVLADTSHDVVALHPGTGEEVWRFDTGAAGAPARGLVYARPPGASSGRIIFAAGGRIFALDARTGREIKAFNGGSISFGWEIRVKPIVVDRRIIVSLYTTGDVYVLDYDHGTVLQHLNFKELASKRSGLEKFLLGEIEGANIWGGIALDVERNLLFLTTGNPSPVGLSQNRVGSNSLANSIIALSLTSGELLWTFQDVRHDLWDLDIASPPILTTVRHRSLLVDVVVATTKSGNVLLVDRTSGKPLFDLRLKKALVSSIPGERTATYQPFPQLPEPFGRTSFTLDDITDIAVANQQSVLNQVIGASMGFFPPHKPDVPTVFFGLHGGSMQYGSAVDERKGVLYVAASHEPSMFTVTSRSGRVSKGISMSPTGAYSRLCSGCHGEELEGGSGPPLTGLAPSFDLASLTKIVKGGLRSMPPIRDASNREISEIFDVIESTARESRQYGPDKMSGVASQNYVRTSYTKLLDFQGYPGSKPPWGTLTATDLSSGRRLWQIPLGKHKELEALGIYNTGTVNIGGPTVTSTGLVFVSGTKDKFVRAFDSVTGAELWASELPFIGTSSPMTYEFEGRQYLLVVATGGGTLALYDPKVAVGNVFTAFRLPD